MNEIVPTPDPRYEVRACPDCRGKGYTTRSVCESGGYTRPDHYECERCDQTGAVLERVRGSYAPVTAGDPGQLRGEPLPPLVDCELRLTEWAQTLAQLMDEDGATTRLPFARELRDDLVLIAAAINDARDRAEEAGTARELRDDARDDETARLHEHVAAVERERDALRAALAAEQGLRSLDAATISGLRGCCEELRLSSLGAEHRMREQGQSGRAQIEERHAAELAGLHDHCEQLSRENEELRSENGALKFAAEAVRAAVNEATQAVLDAGAQLSIARAEAAELLRKADELAAVNEELNRQLLARMSARGVA